MGFRKLLHQFCVQVGGAFSKPVMYVGNPQPFNTQGIFVANKEMGQTHGVQPTGNRQQQVLPAISLDSLLDVG